MKSDLNRYEAAIDDFNKALLLNPNEAQIYCAKGYAQAKLGKYEEAFLDFNKSIEMNPNNAYIYYLRGKIYIDLEKYDLAQKDLEKVLKLSPKDNGDTKELLKSIKAKTGFLKKLKGLLGG